VCLYVHVCTYVWMSLCVHVCLCLYVCMGVSVHTCAVCICVCVCVLVVIRDGRQGIYNLLTVISQAIFMDDKKLLCVCVCVCVCE
jgi:hypothetical protein